MEKMKAAPKNKSAPIEQQLPSVELEEIIRQQGVKPFQGFKEWDAQFGELSDEANFDGVDESYRQYKAEQRALPVKDKFADD